MLMKKNTPESYLAEIKEKYELEKQGKHSSYLSKPSPGLLNDLCTLLTNSGLSNIDKEILNKFIGSEKFDIDKFRPICNFFTGKTKTPKQSLFDMMALLVDFEQRPLGKYLKGETHKSQAETIMIIEKEEEGNKQQLQTIGTVIKKPSVLKTTIFTGSAVLLFGIGSHFFLEKKCILWKKDHYEKVTTDEASIASDGAIVLITDENEHLINSFRKIEPCDTTTFFKNGKACIWYWKTPDDKLECFTAPGFHPENGKHLRPITQHMIDKYILSK